MIETTGNVYYGFRVILQQKIEQVSNQSEIENMQIKSCSYSIYHPIRYDGNENLTADN